MRRRENVEECTRGDAIDSTLRNPNHRIACPLRNLDKCQWQNEPKGKELTHRGMNWFE